jgi:hypothetical protein
LHSKVLYIGHHRTHYGSHALPQRVPVSEPAPRTVTGIIKWWEKRRLFYNVTVGSAGLVSMTTATTVASILEGRLILEPWIGALIFGVMANIC